MFVMLLGMAAGSAGTSAAQDLPAWRIAEVCAKETPQCAAFEARALQAVTGGWGVLPDPYKAACLAEVKSPLDRSWRQLSQCLEQQVLKGLDKRAIATLATPAEPVPPPKPVAAAPTEGAGVPPPPFGLPIAPPPPALFEPPKAQ